MRSPSARMGRALTLGRWKELQADLKTKRVNERKAERERRKERSERKGEEGRGGEGKKMRGKKRR